MFRKLQIGCYDMNVLVGLSLRDDLTSNYSFLYVVITPKADAGNMLKQVIGNMGSAGGHPRMAGGQIPFTGHKEKDWQRLQNLIIARFLRKLDIKKGIEWKSMLIRNGSLS